MDSTPNAPSRRELPLEFSASGSEYFRIWIVNLLLTIVTLGLYLPFAKARRRCPGPGATGGGWACWKAASDRWPWTGLAEGFGGHR